MKKLAFLFCLLSATAMAAPTPAPPSPDMVLLPRATAEAAAQWIAAPNATNAVQLYAALVACINDNPTNGVTVRNGEDQCPAVTAALAQQSKAIADAAAEQKASDAKSAATPKSASVGH